MIDHGDITAALTSLAATRPVFHSEADFQFALAWRLRGQHPVLRVRLEYPVPWVGPRGYVDIWVRDADSSAAIELTYWTRAEEFMVAGEQFRLRDQSAKDLSRYDLWKDVARLEAIVDAGLADVGYAVALTNDQGYWRPGRDGTVDEAFRLSEDRAVTGSLSWAEHAGAGTTRSREAPIEIRGRYLTKWADYSAAKPGSGGGFRHLLIEVARTAERPLRRMTRLLSRRSRLGPAR